MADYIMLLNFSEKGLSQIKNSPTRLQDAKAMFEKSGAKIKSFHAVLGQYDGVVCIEAPDDETMARLSLQLSSEGFVCAETLRAFSEDQYKNLVSKLS